MGGHADPVFPEKAFVYEHQGRNALERKSILPILHLAGFLTGFIVNRQIEPVVQPDQVVQRIKGSGSSQQRKIFRKDQEQIRALSLHVLFSQPLAVTVDSDSADIAYFDSRMRFLENFNRLVEELIPVTDRCPPVTA